jgi:hypothetical protein
MATEWVRHAHITEINTTGGGELMTVPYAEQIMADSKCNQWFLLFHDHMPTWKPHTAQAHFAWMTDNLVRYQLVGTPGEAQPQGSLYHVDFQSHDDPRLIQYMSIFENAAGESLHPDQYQMLEWSYQGWVESGHREEFLSWISQPTQAIEE